MDKYITKPAMLFALMIQDHALSYHFKFFSECTIHVDVKDAFLKSMGEKINFQLT